jgi:undecaprenyl-diphosphatase
MLINLDKAVELFINNLAGRWWLFDELVKGLANDYFLVVGAFMGLLLLWFAAPDSTMRHTNQRLILQAAATVGLSALAVTIVDIFIFRPRPFNEIAVTSILYQPYVSSFPSFSASILFGLAFSIWFGNKPAGRIFLIIASTSSVARLIAGMHYPLDIIGGAAIGALVAMGVRWLFKVCAPFVDLLVGIARALFIGD